MRQEQIRLRNRAGSFNLAVKRQRCLCRGRLTLGDASVVDACADETGQGSTRQRLCACIVVVGQSISGKRRDLVSVELRRH